MRKYKNKILSMILLLTMLLPGFSLSLEAAADMDSNQVIRIGYIDYDGFIVEEEDGSFSGYGVEYLAAISNYTGWTYEYVYDSWENHLEALKRGEIDFLCHAQKTKEREADYIFSEYSVGAESNVLYARKDDERFYYEDFEVIDGITVALLSDSYQNTEFEEYAKLKGFTYNAVYYNTSQDCFTALDEGTVDAVAMGSVANVEGYKVLCRFGSAPFYFMTGNQNTELMATLNLAQGTLTDEDFDFQTELFEKYYGDSAAETDILFTREEMEYIKNAGVIKVGQLIARYPISYLKDEELLGINEDILERISQMSGLNLVSCPLKEGESPVTAVKNKEYDLVMGTIDNEHYREDPQLQLTKPFMESTIGMVMRPDEKFDENKEYVVGLKPSFQFMQEYLAENYPQFEIVYYEDNESILSAVVSGDVDIMVENIYVIDYLLQKPKFEKMKTVPTTYMEEKNCFVALKGENDQLMSIINRCIKYISDEELNKIILENTSAKPYQLTLGDMAYKYRTPFMAIVFLLVMCFALSIMISISRQRHATQIENKNEQLADAVIAAESANQTKSRFLSQMSHEIRTPMNAIVGISGIAREHMGEPEKMEYYLDKIDVSSKVLLNIINDVLDMSAIESGKIKIDYAPFNIKEALQDIFEIYSPQCKAKGIELSLFADISHPMLVGDALRVNQILLNLISNAYKFTEKGGKINIIAMEKQVNENIAFLEFMIEDTGCGMSKEMLERLFKPFEQESAKTAKKYGGSGLGTSIAKGLIEMMEGAIDVASIPGEGTTFYVDIPFEIYGDESMADGKEHRAPNPEDYDFTGYKVLLVEDNELNAEIARELLEMVHLQVDHAINGAEGVEMFERSTAGTYGMILMDIQMPVMDGWEATKAIRKSNHPEGATIPIYAMTANAFREDVSASLSAGMDGHIAKPIDTKLLYATMQKVLKENV